MKDKKTKREKKQVTKNMSIPARIAVTTVLGILIPIIILLSFSPLFLNATASFFNFSTVTTNSYSVLNQIQWSQTLLTISDELVSDDGDDEKLEKLKKLAAPLENLGAKIYVECENKVFYASAEKNEIIKLSQSIVNIDPHKNINYFGENGIVIVNHCRMKNKTYLVMICDENYKVNDVSQGYTAQDITSLIFGKTGLIILIVALIFIVSIVVLSIITSRIITNPLKKLAKGAHEIAGGNLDYTIDYESTNEIGTTVSAFNNMAIHLKASLDEKEQLDLSRKEMIAGVAHDLRTPLTSAKGYVEGLLDGIASTPEMQRRYLKTVYSSTCDMEKLLDELLTISKLELGSVTLDTSPVDINDFLSDCASEISAELENKGFDFEFYNNCKENTIIDLDADRFTRVIRNIISNSIKYTRPDVKGKVILSVQSYQKSVIISIADNGMGLDMKSIPKIFDTFYRADKARSNVRNGSGIGLAVCKQIVELHGGHIWATGKEGEGMTILISLQKRSNSDNDQKNINS